MMTAEFMLSKRPVLRFTAALFFLLKLFSSHIYCILMSEALRISYGFESRHKGIIAKVLSRNLRPPFSSKANYCQSYEDLNC